MEEKVHHSFVKKQGMPIKTLRKNIPEAQQMLFCYCMFCTDGAGVLKNTHPWFALFACLRFSSSFVRRDLPGTREAALPLPPRQAAISEESFALFPEMMHVIFLKTRRKREQSSWQGLKRWCPSSRCAVAGRGEESSASDAWCWSFGARPLKTHLDFSKR